MEVAGLGQQVDALFGARALDRLNRLPKQRVRPVLGQCKGVALVQPGQAQQLGAHALQSLPLLHDGAQRLLALIFGHLGAAQQVGVANHGGHGRLELVGHIGDKLLLRRVLPGEALHMLLRGGGHAVEGERQLAGLIVGMHHRGAGIVIPLRDAAGGLLHPAKRGEAGPQRHPQANGQRRAQRHQQQGCRARLQPRAVINPRKRPGVVQVVGVTLGVDAPVDQQPGRAIQAADAVFAALGGHHVQQRRQLLQKVVVQQPPPGIGHGHLGVVGHVLGGQPHGAAGAVLLGQGAEGGQAGGEAGRKHIAGGQPAVDFAGQVHPEGAQQQQPGQRCAKQQAQRQGDDTDAGAQFHAGASRR